MLRGVIPGGWVVVVPFSKKGTTTLVSHSKGTVPDVHTMFPKKHPEPWRARDDFVWCCMTIPATLTPVITEPSPVLQFCPILRMRIGGIEEIFKVFLPLPTIDSVEVNSSHPWSVQLPPTPLDPTHHQVVIILQLCSFLYLSVQNIWSQIGWYDYEVNHWLSIWCVLMSSAHKCSVIGQTVNSTESNNWTLLRFRPDRPVFPVTPLQVSLSLPTWAWRSPIRTIESPVGALSSTFSNEFKKGEYSELLWLQFLNSKCHIFIIPFKLNRKVCTLIELWLWCRLAKC